MLIECFFVLSLILWLICVAIVNDKSMIGIFCDGYSKKHVVNHSLSEYSTMRVIKSSHDNFDDKYVIDSSYVEYSVNCIIGGYLGGCDYKHVIFREGFD
jgi:hypothetical protein